ncbi:MAG: hypothetical protein ACJ72Q_16330, partial [Nitrososphaeraceae archaeon]
LLLLLCDRSSFFCITVLLTLIRLQPQPHQATMVIRMVMTKRAMIPNPKTKTNRKLEGKTKTPVR